MIAGSWALADRLARFNFKSRFSISVPENIAPVILEYPDGVLRLGYQRGFVLSSLAFFSLLQVVISYRTAYLQPLQQQRHRP